MNSTRFTHRIVLTPFDIYHFADDKKYRNKIQYDQSAKSYKRRVVQDYYQNALMFPQQTSLFGALRYLLLKKNDQIPITDVALANELIGSKSWRLSEETIDFGKLKSISPLFVLDTLTGKEYTLNSKHYFLDENTNAVKKHKLSPSGIKHQEKDIFVIENHDDKSSYIDFLQEYKNPINYQKLIKEEIDNYTNDTSQSNIENSSGTFIKNSKVGINKVKNLKGDLEAFYKIETYKLNKNKAFVLYANLDIEDKVVTTISIGGDGHLFDVNIESCGNDSNNEDLKPSFEESNNVDSLIVSCLSDCYLKSDVYTSIIEKVKFANIEIKPFQHLVTQNTKGHKYYSNNPVGAKDNFFRRSDLKYNLIKRGSVFYFYETDDAIAFKNALRDEKQMRLIGYNFFWNH